MSGLNLSQRLWQLTDEKVQRAFDGFAATYDDTVKKLNNAFDFSTNSLAIRLPVSSPGGFKSVIGPWQKSSSAYPTTPTALAWAIDNTSTNTGNLIQGFIATHPGSIIGMQLAGLSNPAGPVTVTVYKNLAPTPAMLTSTLVTTNTFTYTTFAKGAAPFAAGDRLEIYLSSTVANTGQIVSSFTVEMTA